MAAPGRLRARRVPGATVDAIGVAVFAAGGFLVYAAIKGEHPWTLFVQTLTGAQAGQPGSGIVSLAGVPTVGSGSSDVPDNPVTVGNGEKAA